MADPTLYDNAGNVSGYNIYERLNAEPIAPEFGAMERLAYGAAALAPRAIHNTAETFDALGSWIGLSKLEPPEEDALPSLPPGTTIGQNLADFAGAIAPYAVTLPLGAGAIRAGLGAAGMTSALGKTMIADAALFGGMAAPYGGDIAGEQALEGAGYGLLTALPRMKRILPAAGLAAASKLFFDYKDDRPVIGSFTQGDISAVAGFGTAFLPGQIPTKRAPAPAIPQAAGGSLFNVPTPEGNQTLFNTMFPGANQAPRSAAESAAAMEELILARQNAPPKPAPSVYDITGVEPVPFKSAQESAEVMMQERAARDRAVELEVFRENRVIPARYTPPAEREGFIPPPPQVRPPIPAPGPGAITPTPDYLKMAFDPANFATLANFTGVPVSAIEQAASNLSEIQFAQFIREARNAKRAEMVNMARWAAGLGDERMPTPSPPQISDMFEEMIRKGTATRANPEGTPPVVPEAQIQAAPGEGGTTGITRGKMRMRPEYQTSEGGFITDEALQAIGMPAIRATIGGAAGTAYNEFMAEGEDPLAWLRGAAVGLFGPRFARTFTAATRRAFGVRSELGGLADKFQGGPIPKIKGANLRSEVTIEPKHGDYLASLVEDIGEDVTRMRGFIRAERQGGTDTLMIKLTDLDEELHGYALGSHLYDKLIDEATARGLRVVSDNSVSAKAKAVYDNLQSRGYEVRRNPRAMEMIATDDITGRQMIHLVSASGDPIYEVWPRQGNLIVKTGDKIISNHTGKEWTMIAGGSQTRGRKRITIKNEFEESSAYADGFKTKDGQPILQPLQNPARDRLQAEIESAQVTPSAVPTEMKKPTGPSGTGRVDQGGFVMPELSAAMGRGVLGGFLGSIAGGITDDGDDRSGMVLGGVIGALTFMGGPPLAASITAGLSKMKNRAAVPGPKAASTKVRGIANVAENFSRQIEEMSGSVISKGSTRISDRLVRWLDTGLELTMPPAIKEALLGSKGAASVLLDVIDSALLKVSLRFNPDPTTQKLANEFLDGKFDKMELMRRLAPQITGNPQYNNYAKFLIAGRESISSLQKMVKEGIGDPKMEKIIEDSIGKYITRSYRMFTNPNWRPAEQQVQNLVDELINKQVFKGATRDDIQNMLRQYVAEVKSVKGMYPKFTFSAQGQKINQAVLKERLDLSDAWKEFLGEIQNPTERVYQTVFRLRPMAEASQYFSKLASVVDEDGMPTIFKSYADKDAYKSRILQQLQNPQLDEVSKAKLNFQLTKLAHFMNVESHPKFGELSGQIVNRHVFETLSTYDSFTDISNNPYLRSIANAHTAIKLARTAFNPLTVIRNFVTTPIFMAIGKTNVTDMSTAWEIIKDSDHPLRAEIMRQGIGNVDQVKTEFFKEFENITGSKYNFGSIDMTNLGLGKIDLDIAEKYGRRGFRGVLDAYRLPDNMVRIGTYLSAKRRIAQELGKALDDPEVLSKATEFTNRYTMNYDAVAPAIKKIRQLPFANLFISYTAEMARLVKNLMEDVVLGDQGNLAHHGRLWAGVPLVALAAIPELLEDSSESSLSEKDRRDWDKAKKLMPDYARSRFRYVTGRDKKTGQFHYVDFTPLIASDSFNQVVRAVAKGDTQGAVAVNPLLSWDNTPALNLIVEQATGRDSRTHRDFRGGADRVAAIAKEVLPPWVPSAGSEWQRFAKAHTVNTEGELGITNLKTGVRLTPQDFWASYFGPLVGSMVPPGARPGSTNLEVLQKQAIAQAKSDVANETAYLNDVIKSDSNDEVKARAVERFKVAIAELRENLASRLGESK